MGLTCQRQQQLQNQPQLKDWQLHLILLLLALVSCCSLLLDSLPSSSSSSREVKSAQNAATAAVRQLIALMPQQQQQQATWEMSQAALTIHLTVKQQQQSMQITQTLGLPR
jgi:hypothetical protein